MGVCIAACFSTSVCDAVATQPGATQLTVMPLLPTSSASARLMPTMPAFAALYATSPGFATRGPVTDATLMMRPWPLASMPGNTRRVSK
jgi:hypothetical protein